MRYTRLLMTLAVATLIAVPALSMPWDNKGPGRFGGFEEMNLSEEEMENMTLAELREMKQDANMAACPRGDENTTRCPMNREGMIRGPMGQGMMGPSAMEECPMAMGWGGALLLMDLTEEEMKEMTLAELSALREEKQNEMMNMTAEDIQALRDEKRAEMENMTIAELRELKEDRVDRPFLGGCFLASEMTLEELEGMTIAEIEALKEEKLAELNNMTIAEIEEMNEQMRAEMENMTIAELKERMEVCAALGLGNGRMGGPGASHGGEFRMAGASIGQGCHVNQFGMGAPGMDDMGRGGFGGKMNRAGLAGEA
ncbi:MAG: hypothetical protein PHN90_03030 [Methanothrix sp.]|jgi:hypothetical protein|nr:hypothetical protein [Methanothrix sp.]OPX81577.1 MAG: hypothetical protein A4E50_00903 [Methanosaeta sp. PtaB.Bin087]NLX38564.1 hypothetical protein [Methanothrix sp.]HNR57859.1 hypothetical protein [Methanothrix sp.]HOI70416.1 hypothetical protein [Methanothrix sp.]